MTLTRPSRERQEDLQRFPRSTRDDAEVLVVRLHEDVRAPEMNLVRAQLAAHDQVLVVDRAAIGDPQ